MKDELLKPSFSKHTELSVKDGCILWGNRVIIPKAGRLEVSQELHEAYPGITRMKQLARMFVWWPVMDQDIEEKMKSCAECQFQRPMPPLAPIITMAMAKSSLVQSSHRFSQTIYGPHVFAVNTFKVDGSPPNGFHHCQSYHNYIECMRNSYLCSIGLPE